MYLKNTEKNPIVQVVILYKIFRNFFLHNFIVSIMLIFEQKI